MRDLLASERTVAEVLSQDHRFRVPSYQRPFAWSEEEAGLLLSDISAAQAEAEPSERPGSYFLGGIVLVRAMDDDVARVIDGQQRLTTLTILLAVLRDLDEDGPERLNKHILGPARLTRAVREGIFKPRQLDVDFLKNAIQKPGATATLSDDSLYDNDAQGKMLAIALMFRRDLERLSPRQRARLADYVLNRCVVVEVLTRSEDQGYRIFEVMNARGKDLKENDILKSEIIGHIPQNRQAHYADLWDNIEADVGEGRFTELFSHIRSITRPGKPRKSTVAEIREALNPAADPEGFIERELVPKGDVFRALLEANLRTGQRSTEINGIVRVLNRVNNKDWIPPAIAFFTEGPVRRADETFVFFTALERLAYSLFIQAADAGTRYARYRGPIRAICEGAPLETIVELMALSSHDKRMLRAVLGGKSFFQKEKVCRAVLLRIDEWLAESVAWYEHGEVTVEHVLPQNPPPGSPWIEAFPDARERKNLTDCLGNLALLSRRKNAEAANFEFTRKKQEYFAKGGVTPFAITMQILMEREWNADVVLRRQKRLFDIACRIWDL